jgi:hypothetical protein
MYLSAHFLTFAKRQFRPFSSSRTTLFVGYAFAGHGKGSRARVEPTDLAFSIR